MDLQPIIDFLSQWAFLPASTIIGLIVWWLQAQGIFDPGKFKWAFAVGLGLIFGVVQKFGSFIGYEPIQTEWPKIVIMGIATGLMAVLGQTVIKNTVQGIKKKP